MTASPTNTATTLKRYNLFRESDISGDAAPGFSAGEATAALEAVAAEVLPTGYTYAWSGLSLQEKQSAGQTPIVLGLAVAFVFLFLAALYESFAVPFAVTMMTRGLSSRPLIFSSTRNPERLGSIMSSTTRSGGSSMQAATAAFPSSTVCVSAPSD